MKMRSRLGCVALALVGAGLMVAGCSSAETKPSNAAKEGTANNVSLALRPVAGVTIDSVHFVVSKAGVATPVFEGDLPTSGTASTFSVGLPIPVGANYTLSLSGVSVESAAITCTGSVGPFAVTPNQTTKLTSTLACTDANKGTLDNHITVATDAGPRLSVDYLIITPNSANVGSTIGAFSKTTDLDGKPVTYAWKIGSASLGSFAVANAANTTFSCLAPGLNVPLTITANNGECVKSLATTVSCSNVGCGNGLRDAGETCDPSAGDSLCNADCTRAECGNGIVEFPFEVCDPKLAGDNCGGDCGPITTPACLACEQTNECSYFIGACSRVVGNAAAGSPAAGTPRSYLCNEVLDCVRDSGCAAGGYDVFTRCYCGTANNADCRAGAGNGACKLEFERGMETVDFNLMTQRMINEAYGGGVASQLIRCDQDLCKNACGLQ